MRYLLIAFLFLLSLILPGTVFYFWDWSGIKPDLMMLLVIYLALHHRLLTGVIWGLGAGLVQDLYLGRYIGMYTLTLAVVALFSSWLSQRWYRDNFPLMTLLVFLASALGQLLIGFLSLAAGLAWSGQDIIRLVLGIGIYNAVLVPLTYPWIHRSFMYGWLRYRPKYEQ
ncbi:rod shape-determining protein MreD [Paradesulfitobacterium ferrireducens]|uniref:rod shape-determining protein MreD n=1 Tax=Paradesulfitobacterium ferrireducens TaxID=2816476 RepID=UPI001A8DCA8A|nr:rod shape-determining protein MreD [Paradesulfitobacterium ferrireducens]